MTKNEECFIKYRAVNSIVEWVSLLVGCWTWLLVVCMNRTMLCSGLSSCEFIPTTDSRCLHVCIVSVFTDVGLVSRQQWVVQLKQFAAGWLQPIVLMCCSRFVLCCCTKCKYGLNEQTEIGLLARRWFFIATVTRVICCQRPTAVLTMNTV